MKKLLLYSLFAFAILLSPGVMAQQGIGTNTPDKSSAVDIVSSKRGLLIPRLALTSTDAATPVTDPANSLLVYNTATAGANETAVTPGFYFWDTDRWVRFVDADNVKSISVSAGDGVTVTEDEDGNNTDYKVSVTAGTAEDMVMVTIENPNYDDQDPDSPQFITSWVSYDDLLDDLLNVENGLTYDADTNTLTLGGELTEPTTITTSAANPLTLAGLQAWGTVLDEDDEAIDGDLEDAKVVVMNADGTLRTIDYSSLTVTADNGLTMIDNNIQLGGDLLKPTVITTGTDGDGNPDDANTLAIAGLEAADAANEIVVAESAGGVLRTVKRSISTTTLVALDVEDITDYSSYVQEINISATLAATDYAITLPAASAENRGQVVNIRIANTTEAHDGFLDIDVDGGGTLTYGTMPYQAWVVKSDGTSWVIVGRN